MPMEDFIKIYRKKGFIINPDDDVVNFVLNGILLNDGRCITDVDNRIGHDQCPCTEYLQNNKCHCKLYIKENGKDEEILRKVNTSYACC